MGCGHSPCSGTLFREKDVGQIPRPVDHMNNGHGIGREFIENKVIVIGKIIYPLPDIASRPSHAGECSEVSALLNELCRLEFGSVRVILLDGRNDTVNVSQCGGR